MRLGIILLPLIAPAVLLPLAACEKADIDRVQAALRGDDPPPTTAVYLAAVPASSVEASSSSSEYVATAHLVCPEPFEWRGQMVQNPCWNEYY